MTPRTQLLLAGTTLAKAVVVIVLAVSAVAYKVHAAPPDAAAFESAAVLFRQASGGDNAVIDKAADAFDALLKAEPANPVVMAYAGAATSMRAVTAGSPFKKMGFAEDGLALLDKSLAMLAPAHDAPVERGTPGSLEVRFVAANTFLAVPGFMNRGARGAKLLNDVLASPLFGKAPLGFQGAVWMRAAALAAKEQRADDAKRLLNQVVASGAPQAEQARAQLKAVS